MKKLDKKFSILILIFTFIIFGFLLVLDKEQKNQLKVTKLSSSVINSDDKQVTDYNFDSINIFDDFCTIKGWAIAKGIDSIDVVPSIILVDNENNFYKVKTRIVKRDDITEKINDGRTYDNSGIVSEFKVEGLKKNRKYTIVIQIKINETVYMKWTDVQLPLQ